MAAAAEVEKTVVSEKAAAAVMPVQAEKAVEPETAREMMKVGPENHQKTVEVEAAEHSPEGLT